MVAILHGIAQRAADGTAAVADAVETGRKAVPLAELAWDCTLRHQGPRAGRLPSRQAAFFNAITRRWSASSRGFSC